GSGQAPQLPRTVRLLPALVADAALMAGIPPILPHGHPPEASLAGAGAAAGHDGGKELPVMPPLAPMLARAVKQLPPRDLGYAPKWDGLRSVIFGEGAEVEIGSRNERPMTRYFPEVVTAVQANLPDRCVIDGEIVIPDKAGTRLDFDALLQRVHPAESRVRL